MKPQLIKLLSAVSTFITLCVAISYTQSENWLTAWFLLLIFFALPLLTLNWIEFGQALRNIPSPSRTMFILGVFFGLPQAFFGLLSVICGIAIIGWVLYNSLISRKHEYTGGFLTFGLGPALALFGVVWLRSAFTRQRASEAQQGAQADSPASGGPAA